MDEGQVEASFSSQTPISSCRKTPILNYTKRINIPRDIVGLFQDCKEAKTNEDQATLNIFVKVDPDLVTLHVPGE